MPEVLATAGTDLVEAAPQLLCTRTSEWTGAAHILLSDITGSETHRPTESIKPLARCVGSQRWLVGSLCAGEDPPVAACTEIDL